MSNILALAFVTTLLVRYSANLLQGFYSFPSMAGTLGFEPRRLLHLLVFKTSALSHLCHIPIYVRDFYFLFRGVSLICTQLLSRCYLATGWHRKNRTFDIQINSLSLYQLGYVPIYNASRTMNIFFLKRKGDEINRLLFCAVTYSDYFLSPLLSRYGL